MSGDSATRRGRLIAPREDAQSTRRFASSAGPAPGAFHLRFTTPDEYLRMTSIRNDVFHVTPSSGDWAVKSQGDPAPLHVSESRGEAIDAAEVLARDAGRGRVIVHGPDGAIERQYAVGEAGAEASFSELVRHPAAITGAALALAAVGVGVLLARR